MAPNAAIKAVRGKQKGRAQAPAACFNTGDVYTADAVAAATVMYAGDLGASAAPLCYSGGRVAEGALCFLMPPVMLHASNGHQCTTCCDF